MTTRDTIETFRTLNAEVAALAQQELKAFWLSLDHSDIAKAREALDEYLPALVELYGQSSATVAADFYDEVRTQSTSPRRRFKAVLGDGVDPERVRGTIRWAVGTESALENLLGATQLWVSEYGRNTITRNAQMDPARPLWARVPKGVHTCKFCLMLASRGAVYGSEKSAKSRGDGHRYHPWCDCVPTPVWRGDPLPDGYDPEELYEAYLADR